MFNNFQTALASIDEQTQAVVAKIQEAKEALNKLEMEIGMALACADLERQALEGRGKKATGGEDGELGNIR